MHYIIIILSAALDRPVAERTHGGVEEKCHPPARRPRGTARAQMKKGERWGQITLKFKK